MGTGGGRKAAGEADARAQCPAPARYSACARAATASRHPEPSALPDRASPEQPLPKFGPEWACGDLHYHSQGTDNDDESANSYRGTLQAMNAMGLDFTFATDHAFNIRQIGSARPDFSDELVVPLLRGLRDMSPDRFAFGIDLMNGPAGANRQVTSFPRLTGSGSELAAAQLFLGAEVDVAPETLPGETSSARFCYNVPKVLKALDQQTSGPMISGATRWRFDRRTGEISCSTTRVRTRGSCSRRASTPAST